MKPQNTVYTYYVTHFIELNKGNVTPQYVFAVSTLSYHHRRRRYHHQR